jgi:hypothetical protein
MQPSWAHMLLALLAAAGFAVWPSVAFAQTPPHTPGTICFTKTFWCWADPPGPAGSPCRCPSSYGYVAGTLG